MRLEHQIEQAQSLAASCTALLAGLTHAEAAARDAAQRQQQYAAAQAALDTAEAEYAALQRQLNANRAGLLALQLQPGQPCPVCGATDHPRPAELPQDHVTEQALEAREQALTAQRRATAASSRTAGDAAARAAELRAALTREAAAFFARRGARYTGKPAAELDNAGPARRAGTAAAQPGRGPGRVAGPPCRVQAPGRQARALATRLENLNTQRAALEKQAFAAQRKVANAKAGHAAAAARACSSCSRRCPARETEETLRKLQQALGRLRAARAAAITARDDAARRLHANRAALDALDKALRQLAAARKKHAMWDNLSKTINGNLAGKVKLPFEQYVQAFYFDGVVEAANLRFARMTDGQYRLQRRQSEALGGKTALDLDVFDAYTGKTRPVGSLSGGESFMAALCLALGNQRYHPAECRRRHHRDAVYRRGFGSLDADSLEKAVDTLAGLAGGDKLIGVIAHVEALQARLTRQIRVTKTRAGR